MENVTVKNGFETVGMCREKGFWVNPRATDRESSSSEKRPVKIVKAKSNSSYDSVKEFGKANELKSKIEETHGIVSKNFLTTRQLTELILDLERRKKIEKSRSSEFLNQIKKVVESNEKAKGNKCTERKTKSLNKKKNNQNNEIGCKKIKSVESYRPKKTEKALNIEKIHFLEIIPERETRYENEGNDITLGKDASSFKKLRRKDSDKERKNVEEIDGLKAAGHSLEVHGKIHLEEIDRILVKCNFNTSDPRIEDFAMKRSRNKGTDNAVRRKKSSEKSTGGKVKFESKGTNTSPDKEVFESKRKMSGWQKRPSINELTRELSKKYERQALRLQDERLRLVNLFRKLIDDMNESKNYFSNLRLRENEVKREFIRGRREGIPPEQNLEGRLLTSNRILRTCESKKKNSISERHEMNSENEGSVDYAALSSSEKEKKEEKATGGIIDDDGVSTEEESEKVIGSNKLEEISKALKHEEEQKKEIEKYKDGFAGKTHWENVTDVRSLDQTKSTEPNLFPENEIINDLLRRNSFCNLGRNHEWKSETNGTKTFNICPSMKLSSMEETLQALNEQFTKTKFFPKESTQSGQKPSANSEGLSKTQKALSSCPVETEECLPPELSRSCSDIFRTNPSSLFLSSARCAKQNDFGLECEKAIEATSPESLPRRVFEGERSPKERRKVWDFSTIDFGTSRSVIVTKSEDQLHSDVDTSENQCMDDEGDSEQSLGEALPTSELSEESDNFGRNYCESTESTAGGIVVGSNN